MIVLLALTLSELRISRGHIEAQDAKVAKLLRVTQPALEDAPPLVEDASSVLDQAAPVLRTFGRQLPSAFDVVRTLAPALDRVPAITIMAQELISEAIPAVREVRSGSRYGETIEIVNGLTTQLADNGLASTFAQIRSLLDEVAALDLPQYDATRAVRRLGRVVAIQEQTLAIQQQSLGTQTTTLKTLRRSLDIQRETLVRIRSIDDRLGGQLPIPP